MVIHSSGMDVSCDCLRKLQVTSLLLIEIVLLRFFLFTLYNVEGLKAGVHMNLSEILGSLKRDLKGGKRLWNTTRQLPDPTMAHQVVGQLFGVYLPIFNFKL